MQDLLDAVIQTLKPLPATFGAAFLGVHELDGSGSSVFSAGDVNGDGIDDVLIGAPGADPDGAIDAGETYVVFGTNEGFDAALDLATLDGTNGITLTGSAGRFSVSPAGDVNGDGIDGILIGAPTADPDGASNVGETYLIYGRVDLLNRFDFADGTQDGTIDLANLGLNPADYDVVA